MRKTTKFAAAMMLLAAPVAVQAQSAVEEAAADGNAPQLSPEEMQNFQRGVRIMRAFTAAWTSDQVSEAVKGRLIACLYSNNLARVAAATGQLFENSPNLDYSSPTDLYRAAASVCGVTFRRVPGEDGDEAAEVTPDDGVTGR